ncbi:MAG TPA: 2-phospho-L-lactate guanylyltransferase [Dermatophilaceae bacterium]|nr:2-phospho-L-lactate guanylyltransferase [Dermatophilaceae bacterium]
MNASPGPDWHVVVPVKGGPAAKTRLRRSHAGPVAGLADALARDTVAACAGMPQGRLHVVTSDPGTARWAPVAGALLVADPGGGLDAAAGAGVASARRAGADAVAVLLGDHPALRPPELLEALAAAAPHPSSFMADADGTGTALLAVTGTAPLRPRFGAGSADRHARAGHVRLELAVPGLRRDVDDDASLTAALRLGVGPATAEALRATLPDVQASIHTLAEDGGTALLDDGREVVFADAVLAGSGLRHLRVGQRVSVELDDDGRTLTRVWIVGIGAGETIR